MGISNDIRKPFNILVLAIAVFSIILATYFFSQTRRIQRPTYLIDDEVSKVYDSSKEAPNLIFLKAPTNERIEKDVFLVTVHFWNSGDLSIEPEDIRKPVKFSLLNCEEIVDYDVVEQTNGDVTEFSLSRDDQKSLELNWKHLDGGNGAKFHVFYVGPAKPQYSFSGNILGRTTFVDGRSLRAKYGWIWEQVAMLIGAFFLAVIVTMPVMYRVREKKESVAWVVTYFRRVGPVLMVAVVAYGILLIYVFNYLGVGEPPV